MKEAAEKEWEQFRIERTAGIEEISTLRQKVVAVQSSQRQENGNENSDNAQPSTNGGSVAKTEVASDTVNTNGSSKDTEMEVDAGANNADDDSNGPDAPKVEEEKKHLTAVIPPPAVDEDDAVEY